METLLKYMLVYTTYIYHNISLLYINIAKILTQLNLCLKQSLLLL